MGQRMRHHWWAIVTSAVAILLFTWPLAAQLDTALPMASGDGLENTWNVWWMRQAVLTARDPFWGATLYQPTGTSLLFHALGLAMAPVAVPLQLVVDPPTALVLTLLVALWLTALTSYWLIWDIAHHRLAALMGGLLVAVAPAHLYHLHMGQINLTALFPVPLLLLAQRRALLGRQWRWVAVGGLATVLCALADWQYLVVGLLAASVTQLPLLWSRRAWRLRLTWLARALTPLALGLALLAPLILAMVGDLQTHDDYAVRPAWQAERRSVDLLALVTPNPFHPLWGQLAWGLYQALYPLRDASGDLRPGQPALVNVSVASLSLVALVVALPALRRWRPAAQRWALLLGTGLLLALGPWLSIGGHLSGVPLPYQVLRLIPYFSVSRAPSIFLKTALLALAVLAALGLRRLMALGGRRWAGRALLPALGVLLVLENLSVPLALPTRPAVSDCYRQLAADPRPGAVLDLPTIGTDEPMYYQTVHGRPIFGGDLSRDNPYGFLTTTPVLAELAQADTRDFDEQLAHHSPADLRGVLAGWGVRWVVFRPVDAGDDRQRYERLLERVFAQTAPVCADERTRLWSVEPHLAVLDYVGGWYEDEAIDDLSYRWLRQDGAVIIAAPQAGSATLQLLAWSHQQPRTLVIGLGDQPAVTLTVPVGRPLPISLPLSLPAGRSTIHFRALEPATEGGPSDDRHLSVAIAGLELHEGSVAAASLYKPLPS